VTGVLTPSRGPLQPEWAGGPVRLVVDRLDHAGGIVLVGGIAGLLAIGVGSRGAMRLVALTSGTIGTGVRPESGAVPGTITADGTGFLLMAGTFIGVAIALAVLGGFGRWLPAGARARWWATVALAAVTPAIALLDPGNEDFRLFGPVWLAIGLFTLLPITFGAGVATLATRIPATSHGLLPRTLRVLLGIGGLLGIVVSTVGLGSESLFLLPLPLVVLVGLATGPRVDLMATGTRAAEVLRAGVVVLAITAAGVTAARVVAVAMA
jgi:hypothetical protein